MDVATAAATLLARLRADMQPMDYEEVLLALDARQRRQISIEVAARRVDRTLELYPRLRAEFLRYLCTHDPAAYLSM